MDVQVVSTWNGTDESTREVARLLLIAAVEHRRSRWRDWVTLRRMERQIQPLADSQFGKRQLVVRGVRVRNGSIYVELALVASAVLAYKFVKDFPDLQKGLQALTALVKEREQILEHAIARAQGSPVELVAATLHAAVGVFRPFPVLTGLAIDLAGTMFVGIVWEGFWVSLHPTAHTSALPLVALVPLAAVGAMMTGVGGFVAAQLAVRFGTAHGFVVGMLSLCISMAALWVYPSILSGYPTWLASAQFGALVPLGLLGGYVSDCVRRPDGPSA